MFNSRIRRFVSKLFFLGICVFTFFFFTISNAFAYPSQRVGALAPVSGGIVAPNTGKILVQFDYPVSATQISNASFSLSYNTSSTTYWPYYTGSVSVNAAFNSIINGVVLTPQSALSSDEQYQLIISSASSSSPGVNSMSTSYLYFSTSSANDATAPAVSYTNLSSSLTPASPYLAVRFSEDIDPTTLTSSNVTLSPSVSGSRFFYDVRNRTLYIQFIDAPLTASTTYTLTLNTSVADLSGNGLAATYSNSFTTGSDPATSPSMSWSTLIGSELRVGFDHAMRPSSLLNTSQWSLAVNSTTQAVSSNGIDYDNLTQEMIVRNITATTDASYNFTNASALTSILGTTLSANFSTQGTVVSETTERGNWSSYSTNYMTWVAPIYVWPRDSSGGETTTYYISFPLTRALNHGSMIDLFWPAGFNITNAAAVLPSDSWSNNDINGWNAGTVRISSVSIDQNRLMTRVLLSIDSNGDGVPDAGATTGSTDYISFELKNIVNSETACERNWANSSGGCTLRITMRRSTGAIQEGPIFSESFSIYARGTGSISGRVVSRADGTTGIAGAEVHLSGPTGSKLAITDSTGAFSYSALRSDNQYYYIWVESKSDLYSNQYSGESMQLTAYSPSRSDILIQLQPRNAIISGNLVHSSSLSGTQVSVSGYSESDYGYFQKSLTLSGTSTPYTLRTTPGKIRMYVNQDYTVTGFTSTYSYEQKFISPPSRSVNATSDVTLSGINFLLVSADKTISGSVRDQNGNGLANVYVSAWSNNRDAMGSSAYTTTRTDGTFSFNVAVPAELSQITYNIYAYQYGVGQAEKEIVVYENGTTSPSGIHFIFAKEDATISGTITDNVNNAIQWASITARDNNGNKKWSSTDSSGQYSFFVSPGTWNVEAYAWQYGTLPCKSGSTCTNISVAENASVSAVDFQYDPDAYATISGTITDASGGIRWMSVWAELITTATGSQVGWGNWASTDENGYFSIRVQKNTSAQHYDLRGWASGFGELPPRRNINVSGGNITGQNWDLGSIRTVTVSVSNIPTSVVTAKVNFYTDTAQLGSWTNVTLSNGSGSSSIQLPDGTYSVKMHIPGFGTFTPTSPASSAVTINANTTISFDLPSSLTAMTVSGVVRDANANAIPQVRVTLYSNKSGVGSGAYTDNSGAFSLTVATGTYILHVQRTGYIGSEQTVSAAGSHTIALTSADSTITGTLLNATGNAVSDGFVWAIASDNTWAGERIQGNGTFSLDVSSGKTWTVYGMTVNGYKGSVSNVSSGASSVTITASTRQITSLANAVSRSAVPSNGIVLDDSTNTGVNITASPGLWTNSSGDNTEPGMLSVSEVPIFETTQNVDAVGDTAVEITLNDSSSQSVTQLQGNLNLTLTLTKAEIVAAVADNDMTYGNLSVLQNAFWDTTSGTWQTLDTTRKVEVKATSSSSFAAVDYSTFVSNVTANANTYYDYRILLETQVDHFTIFAPVVPPDPPTDDGGDTPEPPPSTRVQGGGLYPSKKQPSLVEKDIIRDGKKISHGTAPEESQILSSSAIRQLSLPRHFSNFAVRYLAKRGVSLLESDGATYRPNAMLSRAEIIDVLLRAFDVPLSDRRDSFSDVSEFHPFATAVATAKQRGFIQGNPNGTFRPDDAMNRAELIHVLLHISSFASENHALRASPFVDVARNNWFSRDVDRAYDLRLIRGYREQGKYYFKPSQGVTQAELAVLVVRVLQKQ